jgi:hypothetical protein
MFDDAFAKLESQIEAREIQIALLEMLDDAQGVKIMVESFAILAHSQIKLPLARMPERGMSNIVDQCERFGEVRIQIQGAGHRPRNLSYFERMRQPVSKMVGKTSCENLRLGFKAAKGSRMDYTIAVSRVFVPIWMWRFFVAASAGPPHVHSIGSEWHEGILVRSAESWVILSRKASR